MELSSSRYFVEDSLSGGLDSGKYAPALSNKVYPYNVKARPSLKSGLVTPASNEINLLFVNDIIATIELPLQDNNNYKGQQH